MSYDSFKVLKSSAVPLPIENVDTDQIIPARFLKATERKGFGDNLFRDWRFNQDNSIKKDLNILCFNENQLIGNGLVIPSGPLREDLSAVKNAQIVIINGFKNISFEEKILKLNSKISFFYCHYDKHHLFVLLDFSP